MEPKRRPAKEQPDDVVTQGQPPDHTQKGAGTRRREDERHVQDVPDKGKTEPREEGTHAQRNPKRGGA